MSSTAEANGGEEEKLEQGGVRGEREGTTRETGVEGKILVEQEGWSTTVHKRESGEREEKEELRGEQDSDEKEKESLLPQDWKESKKVAKPEEIEPGQTSKGEERRGKSRDACEENSCESGENGKECFESTVTDKGREG